MVLCFIMSEVSLRGARNFPGRNGLKIVIVMGGYINALGAAGMEKEVGNFLPITSPHFKDHDSLSHVLI